MTKQEQKKIEDMTLQERQRIIEEYLVRRLQKETIKCAKETYQEVSC